jgi:hypothetical protein
MSEIVPIIIGYRRVKFGEHLSTSTVLGKFRINLTDLTSSELTTDELKNLTLPWTFPPVTQFSVQPTSTPSYYQSEFNFYASSSNLTNVKIKSIGDTIVIYWSRYSLSYGGYEYGIEYSPIYKYTTDKPRNNLQFNPFGIYSLVSINIKIEDTIEKYNKLRLTDRHRSDTDNSVESIHGYLDDTYTVDSQSEYNYLNTWDWENNLLDVSVDTNKFIPPSAFRSIPFDAYTKQIKDSYQYLRSFLAFQTFSPAPIPVNFRQYVTTYFITEGLIERTIKKARITMFANQPTEYTNKLTDFKTYWLTKSIDRHLEGLRGVRADNGQPVYGNVTYNWTYKDFTTHAGTSETINNVRSDFVANYGRKLDNPYQQFANNNYFYRDDDNIYWIPGTPNINISIASVSKTYTKWFKVEIIESTIRASTYPNYIHLLTGYKPLDTRDISPSLTFTSPMTGKVRIGFYQVDPSESATAYGCIDTIDLNKKEAVRLQTINWVELELSLVKDSPQTINFNGLVLGTLYCSNEQVKSSISSGTLPAGNYYPISAMIYDTSAISSLFSSWISLWSSANANIIDPDLPGDWNTLETLSITNRITKIVGSPILAAFNNPWNNAALPVDRFPPAGDEYHPMFTDNDLGVFNLNSPQLLDIYTALEAAKFSRNEISASAARVSTLGWYLERIAKVLGIRVDANGKVDRETEKRLYMASTLVSPKYDKDLYGMNAWGDRGLVVPHLPTSYDRNGRLQKRYDVVHDYAQLLQAILGQLDESIGIQNGSEIRVKNLNGETIGYPNQLALLLDLHRQLQQVNDRTDDTYRITLVSGAEIRELFGGIGIPVTQKYLSAIPASRDSKASKKQLLYFGYQKSKPSILSHLTTLSINVGIILGTLMPKRSESARLNPFKLFKGKSK